MLWQVTADNNQEIVEADNPVDATIIMLQYCQKKVNGENFLFRDITVRTVKVLRGD